MVSNPTTSRRARRPQRRSQRRAARTAQLGLAQLGLALRGQRGGWRAAAGRPKGRRTSSLVPHRRRARINRHQAAHITVKVLPMRRSLRSPRAKRALEAIFRAEKRRKGFRLLHYSIQRDHMHLLCEGNHTLALSRGMQRLCSRVARRINKLWQRRGTFFADRYHGHILKTPRAMRNALRYVLLNRHKDAFIEAPGLRPVRGFDPYSSARWFDGWRRGVGARCRGQPLPTQAPITEPTSWLARTGWRRHGLVSPVAIVKAWIATAVRRRARR